MASGAVFGEYHYGTTLGWAWRGVPVVIAFNWLLVINGSICLARRVVPGLPVFLRQLVPALLTGLVSLLKDSTLGYVVSYPELMQQGRTVTAYYGYLIQTFLAISVLYVVLNYLLTKVASWLQARSTRKATANPAALVAEPAAAQ